MILSIQQILVRAAGHTYALPLRAVRETPRFRPEDEPRVQHGQVIFLRDVALLVAGFVSWRITRGLQRKLREVANQLRALTAGGADLGARLPVTSSDEIGALTTAFNAFQDSLGLIVRSLLDNALKLSSGTTRMSAATNQMSAGADSQTQQVVRVSSAMEEMTAAMQQVARNAQATSSAQRHSAGSRVT